MDSFGSGNMTKTSHIAAKSNGLIQLFRIILV